MSGGHFCALMVAAKCPTPEDCEIKGCGQRLRQIARAEAPPTSAGLPATTLQPIDLAPLRGASQLGLVERAVIRAHDALERRFGPKKDLTVDIADPNPPAAALPPPMPVLVTLPPPPPAPPLTPPLPAPLPLKAVGPMTPTAFPTVTVRKVGRVWMIAVDGVVVDGSADRAEIGAAVAQLLPA